MSGAWIRKRARPGRKTQAGERKPYVAYTVCYRLGGRDTKVEYAGTFRTQAEAKTRRDLIAGELAAGRNPRAALSALERPILRPRYQQVAEAYLRSRIDLDEKTIDYTRKVLKWLLPIFGDTDPHEQTVADQISAVVQLAASLQPSTVAHYWGTHRRILDFAGVKPNPARDNTVRLPTVLTEEVAPPPAAHVVAMLERIPTRWRLPFVTIEQTAMTAGEVEQLAWGDVDVIGGRFRLRRATVKARIRARARWVQVPDWLMGMIADTCPVEDRTAERRVFAGFTGASLKTAMWRACNTAQITVYSPHDLRHRRISLWHGQGIPARQLAERAGHSRASMSLDTYSHVMPLDEVPSERLTALVVRTR